MVQILCISIIKSLKVTQMRMIKLVFNICFNNYLKLLNGNKEFNKLMITSHVT